MHPVFVTYFQEKERGGRGVTMRTCAFATQLSPPPLPTYSRTVIDKALLCAVEEDNSFDRHAVAVLKDGGVVGYVYVRVAIF